VSDASPQDLAVSFRSVPRRRREAAGDAPPEVVGPLSHEIDRQLGLAAGLMHSAGDAESIATAISAVRAKEWDETTLASLRTIAIEVGKLLRQMAALVEDDDR